MFLIEIFFSGIKNLTEIINTIRTRSMNEALLSLRVYPNQFRNGAISILIRLI
jgi:hypothetical protein